MPTPVPYFLHPWSVSASDDTTIPPTGSPSGALSYQYGFTPNYELDLLTNPSALPIPRNYTNQLYFDITSAIQQLQLYGYPNWVSVGSGGPATGYPLYATVLYIDGNIYQSATASNTSTPGVNNDWILLNNVVTPWVAYTPTFTGFGTPTGVSIYSRRVGNVLEIRGNFTTGTSTAALATLTLGFNGTNANVLSSNVSIGNIQICGSWTTSLAAVAFPTMLIQANQVFVNFGAMSATTAGNDPIDGNVLTGTGTAVTFMCSVPVDVWPV